jgi:vacuolar-type H+-ATPase subunit H
MYMETVKELQKLEEQWEQAKTDARARSRERLGAAEKEGRTRLATAQQSIRKEDAEAMRACEAQAAEQREKVLLSAEADCQALRQRAQSHMDEAVAQIVGRVVGN